jgi:hypothetical protein
MLNDKRIFSLVINVSTVGEMDGTDTKGETETEEVIDEGEVIGEEGEGE